jgi:DAK2 domain fusion protein YloV
MANSDKESAKTQNKVISKTNKKNQLILETINVDQLKAMFLQGTEMIAKNFEYIDELNVFPVPDGDTGTNMKITFEEACKVIKHINFESLHTLCKEFKRAVLMNARGNSGVICSQIIRGFANDITENQKVIDITQLVQCFNNAKTIAYNSVTSPVEGTILTVIRMIADGLKKSLNSFKNINDVLEKAIVVGEEALAMTPDLLPELKEVGVVDSGGYGLMRFIEGMYKSFDQADEKKIEKEINNSVKRPVRNTFIPAFVDNNEGFGYCCEFICSLGSKVEYNQKDKSSFDLKKFKSTLEKMGDSLVIVSDENIVKVHIHAISPFKIYEYASQFGEFDKIKIENMTLQFLQRNPGTTLDILHKIKNPNIFENNDEKQVIIATVPSHEVVKLYSNKLNIDITINVGEIGNPSIQSFIDAVKKSNSKNILIVIDDQNYYLSAQEALKLLPKHINVEIINAKNPVSAYCACLSFIDSNDFNNNAKIMNKAMNEYDVFKISRSIKDVKYKHISIKKNEFIGIIGKKIVASGQTLDQV